LSREVFVNTKTGDIQKRVSDVLFSPSQNRPLFILKSLKDEARMKLYHL
jgi:hypothetical protein